MDLGARALDARLHAGDREAGDRGRLDLGEAAEVSERQRFAIRLRQPPHKRFEAAGELLGSVLVVRAIVSVAVGLDAQVSEAAVKPEQHLLGHIVGGLRVGNAGADKPAETRVEVLPEPVCRRNFGLGLLRRLGACVYWHPQLTEAGSSPQQSVLADASQQVACTAGAQQDAGGRSGGGAGMVSVWSSIPTPLVRRFTRADEGDPKGMQIGVAATATGKA